MSDAPETIWAFHAGPMVGYFVGKDPGRGANVAEYRRADLPATDLLEMANPNVQALVDEVKSAIVCLDAGVLDGFARLRLENALATLEADT